MQRTGSRFVAASKERLLHGTAHLDFGCVCLVAMFDHEGSSCCLKSLPCCVPQKESLLWATNASNITISGGGVIDGNAPNNDWHRGAGNVSADGKHFAPFYNNFWHMCRPRMVELRWVKNPKIANLTIQNSIMFNVHTAHVTNLHVLRRNLVKLRQSQGADLAKREPPSAGRATPGPPSGRAGRPTRAAPAPPSA